MPRHAAVAAAENAMSGTRTDSDQCQRAVEGEGALGTEHG